MIDCPIRIDKFFYVHLRGRAIKLSLINANFHTQQLPRSKVFYLNNDGIAKENEVPDHLPWINAGYSVCSQNLERDIFNISKYMNDLDDLFDRSGNYNGFRFNFYQSAANSGLSLHFDIKDIVVVQLEGVKEWLVSEKPAINKKKLLNNYFPPQGITRAIYNGASVKIPSIRQLKSVILERGDILCLPAACWHTTTATTISRSLTIALP